MTPSQARSLRSLPAVDDLLQAEEVVQWCEVVSHTAVVSALRQALDCVRARILKNGDFDSAVDERLILDLAEEALARDAIPSLRRVINTTGVVLHTGLGRAPLCADAIESIADAASGYANVEYDLATGQRGKRTAHVAEWLTRLTHSEAATIVNNNAAAMVLIMRVLCEGREVIVSRGHLVEIGGSFRMPEVMAAGGAVLREVGTTNRTRIDDFRNAINENTAALLRVHSSNFRMVGFTQEPTIHEIAECARTNNLIAIDDLGSGAMFDLARIGLPGEPFVRDSIEAGVDLACFSGDKLLGGPQSGIIVGRRDLIQKIESHPLMRTYRIDKLVLLALEATLRHHLDPEDAVKTIPALTMITASVDELRPRAVTLYAQLTSALPDDAFEIADDISYAGGGSLPGEGLKTVTVRWRPADTSADEKAAALRNTDPPVIVRIRNNSICLDLRTIPESEFDTLVDALQQATFDIDTPCHE